MSTRCIFLAVASFGVGYWLGKKSCLPANTIPGGGGVPAPVAQPVFLNTPVPVNADENSKCAAALCIEEKPVVVWDHVIRKADTAPDFNSLKIRGFLA